MKRFRVAWSERHDVWVEAENEQEAINKVKEGEFSRENAEIENWFEAFEIKD